MLNLDRSKIPHKSGVYQFKNKADKVIYVGKAIDLYSRVTSYFRKDLPLKTASLVEKIESLDTIVVESELEALILEANLIKKYLPTFNVRLTDDRDYLYIGVTKEDSPRSAGGAGFPKVLTVRKKDLDLMKKYWGPFPSARTVRDTLKMLRRIFPWCSNPPKYRFVNSKTIQFRQNRACFYYHLRLCPGACLGLITQFEYNKIIKRFSKFLEGKKSELVSELIHDMEQASKEQRFEEAGKLKKIMAGISYLTQTNRTHLYLENPNFLENEREAALKQLQKDLNLPKLPQRIEGYDISNIAGQDATGSMVVLTDGEIDKSQYRKFKIHLSGKPNDVGMMREMVRRRLAHREWPAPDLILVDGGRGQARGVWAAIKQLSNLDIPLFGLAKRAEWLYPPEGEIIKLSKRSLSLKLLQKLRDESHRFAVAYHRKLHRKTFFI